MMCKPVNSIKVTAGGASLPLGAIKLQKKWVQPDDIVKIVSVKLQTVKIKLTQKTVLFVACFNLRNVILVERPWWNRR